MKIVVFRHAEKQSGIGGDLSLSPHGIKQALTLKDKVEHGEIIRPDILITSPKKRSYETFMPLAQALRLPIQKDLALDEQTSPENINVFRARIHKFIDDVQDHSNKTVFICSHLDWIEQFSTLLTCDTDLHTLVDFSWTPGSYMLFDVSDIWHLTDKGVIS
jgi:broad specificity phosphatase PhoE